MKNFIIDVWYRSGEDQEDFETRQIVAESLEQAVNIATKLYKTRSVTSFDFVHEGKQYNYKPLTKNDLFNLTSPK